MNSGALSQRRCTRSRWLRLQRRFVVSNHPPEPTSSSRSHHPPQERQMRSKQTSWRRSPSRTAMPSSTPLKQWKEIRLFPRATPGAMADSSCGLTPHCPCGPAHGPSRNRISLTPRPAGLLRGRETAPARHAQLAGAGSAPSRRIRHH
ncbi:hypothetical protein M758_UG190700 [Ceratodon purpureus]|nr:hypothetical protein M758_UG190700 [Ceratodon purpureus]